MAYDLIIIGGGPAGVAAAVYAARKTLKTAFISAEWGGQSVESVGIENWIGTVKISGNDFAKTLEAHLKAYAGQCVDIKVPARAAKIEKTAEGFSVALENGETISGKTVLLTMGSTRRKLEVPGAKEYENRGIVYCASCDGPLFSGMDVVVVGGGNAALESAAQLLAYTKSVTIMLRGNEFRGDPVTVARVTAHPNLTVIKNAAIERIEGDGFVNKLIYKDTAGTEIALPTNGIFVEIGLLPSTGFVKGFVDMNEIGQIKVDPRSQATSVSGVWAAGDCTDGLYHQNNIAAGDAVKALEDIYMHLKAR